MKELLDSAARKDLTEKLVTFPEIKEIKFSDSKLRKFKGQNIFTHSKNISKDFNEGDLRKQFIEALALYIVSPIIIDYFSSHHTRKKWCKDLEKYDQQLYKFYSLNKLRLNTIFRVLGILQVYEIFGIKNPSWEEEFQRTYKMISKEINYDDFEPETKLEIVQQVTVLARKAYKDIVEEVFQ